MRVLLASLLALAVNVKGFAVVAPSARSSVAPRTRVMMSEPSDTSSDSDDILTIESEAYLPTVEEAMVTSVLDRLSGISGEVSSDTRSAINEALLQLEANNPTENPTMSPLLNGVWELRYAAGYANEWALQSPTRQLELFLYSGGYSPGLFALSTAQQLPFVEVGDLEITISRDQPRIEATVDVQVFGMSAEDVVVKARLDVQSGVRFSEVYESATVLGRTIDLPAQVQYARDLYVTYVDEDLLVVRDASGVPEVLVRKQKTFVGNWGTDPSALDDMVPPGDDGTELPATD
eukprot:CAMPEP_0119003720 /NCGR_PEP_ID=MMETSP1176-20130426/727_1 /TAXON_ID=265551 /ORGANISM="Synedropsis recta cf, Strain CCMP1620" /LENGTH=290 /DNA_ID=CAMNT_0006955345 /DNA_START=91 /DNA_END=963 /DNA_ORIENTATION=+